MFVVKVTRLPFPPTLCALEVTTDAFRSGFDHRHVTANVEELMERYCPRLRCVSFSAYWWIIRHRYDEYGQVQCDQILRER
jgi:hypothetical protein